VDAKHARLGGLVTKLAARTENEHAEMKNETPTLGLQHHVCMARNHAARCANREHGQTTEAAPLFVKVSQDASRTPLFGQSVLARSGRSYTSNLQANGASFHLTI
jgi:hypothetical protein